MSMHTAASSFIDRSPTPTTPGEQDWMELWAIKGAPTIAQLAHHRAEQLDDTSPYNYPAPYDSAFFENDKHSQKYEPTLPSTRGSGVFLPVSSSTPPFTPPQAAPQSSMTRTQEIAFIFITCIAQFLSLSALNQTVAPVLVLADYFHIEGYGTLSWFSASFSMSVGTFILPAGRLGDMYGHKRIYLIGWLWFSVWSLITGFSYTSNNIMFSICRAFQGIGPALLVPNAVALIGRTLPIGRKRMIGFACFGAMGPLGATAGAVFSALLSDLAWWPWCFWILSIVCLLAMGLAFVILPAESVVTPGIKGPQRPTFDYWGTFTGVSGLVLINFALNQAPLVTWANPYIGTLLAIGILFMVAFVLVELYATDEPLIPIRGLGRDAVFALTCIVAGWASHGIWAYYLYLFLEHIRGHSALLTSAETSPVALTGVAFALSTVWLIQKFGVSYVMFISMALFMVGALLLATMPIHQTYWAQTFVSILIMPGAMNLSYPAANILMSSTLPKEKQGIAASLVSTLVNYSISCGLGFAGTIDRYVIAHEGEKRGIHGNPAPLEDVSPETSAMRLKGLRAAYWLAVAFASLGMLVAFAFILVTEKRKRDQERSSQISPLNRQSRLYRLSRAFF